MNEWQTVWDRLKELNVLFKMFDTPAEVYYKDSGCGKPFVLEIYPGPGWNIPLGSQSETVRFKTLAGLEAQTHFFISSHQASVINGTSE